MEKQLNWKYSMSQALNSGLLAAMLVFASVYLLDKGLTNATIGTVLAISSVASILIQTFFANLADKIQNLTLQDMLISLLIVVILASVVLIISPSLMLFLLAVVVAFSLSQSTVPFLNSLAFAFEEQNLQINFGVGRAFGSLAYAIVTLLVGYAIEWTRPSILPVFYIGIALMLIFVLHSYRLPDNPQTPGEIKAEPVSADAVFPADNESIPVEQQSLKDFLTNYRELFFVIVGVGFAMFGQTMLSTFLIQVVEPIGGDSSTVGLAIAIGALVEVPVLMKFDWFLNKRSAAFWLKVSMIFYVAKAFILLFSSSIPLIYAAQLLQTGSYALAYPAAVQYIKTAVSKKDLFKGQTMFTIGTTSSSVFANLLGGLLIDYLGLMQMVSFAFLATVFGAIVTVVVLAKAPDESVALAAAPKE